MLCVALLTSCVPVATASPPRFAAETRVEGNDIIVTVTNLGPTDLLLENRCPYPFRASVDGLPFVKLPPGPLFGQVKNIRACTPLIRPPELWPVGKSRSAYATTYVDESLPRGIYTLEGWADLRVEFVSGTHPQGDYQTIRVKALPVTVTLP